MTKFAYYLSEVFLSEIFRLSKLLAVDLGLLQTYAMAKRLLCSVLSSQIILFFHIINSQYIYIYIYYFLVNVFVNKS